mmetsp:Transcript_11490/g.22898  ORF Transcript_11490/g.22898 Transcript_11490/m.22898 type:complete len:252 (-) Transcript_11490:522-1277(-)
MSSKFVTERQRWRMEVPMQSVPVSPPPITITSLPAAFINSSLDHALSMFPSLVMSSLFWFFVRNSIAKCTPLRSLPGTGRSLGMVAPTQRASASKFDLSSWTSMFLPMSAFVTNSMPSERRRSTRRSTVSLESFMLGMPYMRRPPMRSSLSKTVTECPIWLSSSAAASPAGPLPTTATVIPVLTFGTRGVMYPSSQALSTMEYSMFLMVTGESTRPATHAPSHGAGQTRPVNSGKLFVEWRRSMASRSWPS